MGYGQYPNPISEAKGRITAEEREKLVLIYLSFNGQLDFRFNGKPTGIYLATLLTCTDEKNSNVLVKFNNPRIKVR